MVGITTIEIGIILHIERARTRCSISWATIACCASTQMVMDEIFDYYSEFDWEALNPSLKLWIYIIAIS